MALETVNVQSSPDEQEPSPRRRRRPEERGLPSDKDLKELADTCLVTQKRLVGVSDGFDTNSQMWKFILSIFAALHEWFIDQLREKVNRGMDDAFRRGTNTGLPALGYKLVPAVDSQGKPICGKPGEQRKMLAIDRAKARHVLKVFELYALGWSRERIARYFNE